MEDQMQVGVDVGETSMAYVSRIDVELQKMINVIEEHGIITPGVMLELENVQLHVEIYGGDILNFKYYNNLPHPSFQVERMGGVFFGQNFCCNTFISCGLRTFASPSFSM
jgi:hypothetical protein